jgi:hypothetical protein
MYFLDHIKGEIELFKRELNRGASRSVLNQVKPVRVRGQLDTRNIFSSESRKSRFSKFVNVGFLAIGAFIIGSGLYLESLRNTGSTQK